MKKLISVLLLTLMTFVSVCGASADGIATNMSIEWDGAYDVVVIGFGGAGAVAAKNAAEAGAKVLIVEKAPEGHEGGNTRYCAQMFVDGGGNPDEVMTYYKALNGKHEVPEELLKVYCHGIADMKAIIAEETGLNQDDFVNAKLLTGNGAEYPELPGSGTITMWAAHEGTSDGYLWQVLRGNVVENNSMIDVWFESPAVHLIQEPTTKTILGVQVERSGEILNIKANNGVVMALGGFENNEEMVETYLGLANSSFFGSKYNTGDGVRMAMEVGADLWHMHVYEALGALGGVNVVTEGDEVVNTYTSYMPAYTSGSVVLVAGDGKRFVDETFSTRHGHVKNHDMYVNLNFPENMYLIVSEENYRMMLSYPFGINAEYPHMYSGATLDELAAAAGIDAEGLKATIEQHNADALSGTVDEFGRSAEKKKAFPAEGPYYALRMAPSILNTQGGARKNEKCEVLDVNGNVIPHLYAAGEFGGICAHQYQGGGNVAECIIFGQIAGTNAAAVKKALPEGLVTDVMENAKYVPGVMTDIVVADYSHIELGENEYLGIGEGGMGGSVVCKVKIVDGKIEAIEVVEHAETAGISDPAIANMPGKILEAQSVEVDNVSGATLTSNAIKNAVANALEQVK